MVRVVVIGSGPVGAAVATRLAERGCATTLLEAGVPRPLIGLPSARPGEHIRNQAQYQREPEAFTLEAMTACAFFDATVPPEGLPGASETIAFGGQGLLWTANCPRTQAGVDRWPALTDEAWERRYAEAEALLQVCGDLCGDSERQQRVAARLKTALATVGRRVEPLPVAARRDEQGGVHWIATADILATLGTNARHLTVRSATRAVRIEHAGGRALAAHALSGGREERLMADAVVVAAGAFATPRLLFASGVRSPALGRWLHYHPLLLGQLVLDESLSSRSSTDPPPRLWIPPSRGAPWHGMILRDVGAGVPEAAADERRLIELQFFAPIEPRAEHHMTLDGDIPRFDVRLGDGDRATLAAMRADVLEIAALLGSWRKGCAPEWNPWGFSHAMGTTRMGDDPRTSVVDLTGRVHGFDNLYVAGVSVVPVPIAVNPTLTAVALALETAENVS